MKIPHTDEDYGPIIYEPEDGRPCLQRSARGELRVPSLVYRTRDYAAQKAISKKTGEHAGHLIGIQFGGAGGAENLGLQNPNMNTYAPKALQEIFCGHGGSYLEMENDWARKLEAGIRIMVEIRDQYRRDGAYGTKELTRPYARVVNHSIRYRGKDWERMPQLIFPNFTSPQSRGSERNPLNRR